MTGTLLPSRCAWHSVTLARDFDKPDKAVSYRSARDTEWLRVERRLELKAGGQSVVSTREACVFLGYRVSRAGVSASRKLRRPFDERLARAAERGEEAVQRTVAAYRGLSAF